LERSTANDRDQHNIGAQDLEGRPFHLASGFGERLQIEPRRKFDLIAQHK
jgi:hypothetical protein